MLFLVTLSSFNDTIHSYNRVKPEKSIIVTYEDGTEGALSALSISTPGLEPAQGVEQAPASRVEMPSLLPSEHPPSRGRYTDCNARRLRPYAARGCHPCCRDRGRPCFPTSQGSQRTVRTVLQPARRCWYDTTTEEGDVCLGTG